MPRLIQRPTVPARLPKYSHQSATETPNPYASLEGEIKGTGATFPQLFYTYAIEKFQDVAPDLVVTYGGGGSGAGRKDFTNNLNDFAGTDSLVKAGQPDNPAAGDFINAELLGTPRQAMIGNVIQSRYLELTDYPTAAALSFVLMALCLLIVLVWAKLAGTEALMGSEAR